MPFPQYFLCQHRSPKSVYIKHPVNIGCLFLLAIDYILISDITDLLKVTIELVSSHSLLPQAQYL